MASSSEGGYVGRCNYIPRDAKMVSGSRQMVLTRRAGSRAGYAEIA